MKKILVIGTNRKLHPYNRFIEELRKKKVGYNFVKYGELCFAGYNLFKNTQKINLNEYGGILLAAPGYAILSKKSGKIAKKTAMKLSNELHVLAKILKENNIKLINRDFIIDNAFYNKFTQAYLFDKYDIPTIPTFHLSDSSYKKAVRMIEENKFNFPIVIKESNAGMGLKVWKIDTKTKLQKFLKNKRNHNLIFQSFIANDGDYRVLINNYKSLGIMKRIAAKGKWKNNFWLGGTVEQYHDSRMERFAEVVCKKMGLEYGGVDVLCIDGKYVVIEVNLHACFEGFEKTYPDLNVAKQIVQLLLSKR